MGAGSPVHGKYITEEVVYQQTDGGGLKYSLAPRRSYQPDAGESPRMSRL